MLEKTKHCLTVCGPILTLVPLGDKDKHHFLLFCILNFLKTINIKYLNILKRIKLSKLYLFCYDTSETLINFYLWNFQHNN